MSELIITLPGIGSYFQQEFTKHKITTLKQLQNKMKKLKTMQEKKVFLEKVLINPRGGECVGKKYKINDRAYMARKINKNAWNTIIDFLKNKEIKNLPRKRGRQRLNISFPTKCEK
jgi:hypothetical protein